VDGIAEGAGFLLKAGEALLERVEAGRTGLFGLSVVLSAGIFRHVSRSLDNPDSIESGMKKSR
jgi:hypothetical protein